MLVLFLLFEIFFFEYFGKEGGLSPVRSTIPSSGWDKAIQYINRVFVRVRVRLRVRVRTNEIACCFHGSTL